MRNEIPVMMASTVVLQLLFVTSIEAFSLGSNRPKQSIIRPRKESKTCRRAAEQDYDSEIALFDGTDSTSLGNLRVPSIGVGTIAWSSDKCKFNK